ATRRFAAAQLAARADGLECRSRCGRVAGNAAPAAETARSTAAQSQGRQAVSLTRNYALGALVAALLVVVALPFSAQAANDGVVPAHDQPKPTGYRPEARIDEQIGAQVPVDLTFRDEDDQPITL